MPSISLAEVAANRRTIEVDLGLPPKDDGTAQTLTVTYRVSTITPRDELWLNSPPVSGEGEKRLGELFSLLKRLIEKWGLTGPLSTDDGTVLVADGDPVPLEPNVLGILSSSILASVARACLIDSTSDPKASTATATK